MKQSAVVLIVSLTVCLVGCGSKELTRSRAEKILKNVSIQLKETICLGDQEVPQTTMAQFEEGENITFYQTFHTSYGKWFRRLADDGLITMQWKGMKGYRGLVDVELTNKGKKHVVGGEPRLTCDSGRFSVVEMCRTEVDKVTGISMTDMATAKVEYLWKIGTRSPFDTAMISVWGNDAYCASNESKPAAVNMRLYDDGWRIVE